MGALIFCATPSNSFSIWLWINICHVSDVHWPDFLIVEYLYPVIFSAISPPSRSECALVMLGSITPYCSLRVFEAVLTALTIYLLVTYVHDLLHYTSQIRFSSVPLFLSMRCTLHARASAYPLLIVDLWCKVSPILPFLWFYFLVLLSPPQAVCSVFHA